ILGYCIVQRILEIPRLFDNAIKRSNLGVILLWFKHSLLWFDLLILRTETLPSDCMRVSVMV
ncbi:MAG: hypothetical protein ACJ703_00945, partial [Nitrososphaera sp.]